MDILFSGELASLAGLSPEALKAQLQTEDGQFKSDAAKTFATLVLDKFKSQEREAKEQQYNRGIREAKEAAERAAKPLFQKYGVQAERFEEAIEQLTEKLAEDTPGDAGAQGLTAEQISKHPEFKRIADERVTEAVEKWKKKLESTQAEYDQYKAQTEQAKVANVVMAKTREALEKDGRQPLYGAKGAEEAVKMFWAYHGLGNIKVDDNGQPQLLDKDGNVLRDEMSNPVDFHKFVESNWILGFKESAGNGSPPHQGRNNPGGGHTSPDALKARLESAKTPEERAEALRQAAEALRKSEK